MVDKIGVWMDKIGLFPRPRVSEWVMMVMTGCRKDKMVYKRNEIDGRVMDLFD